MKQSKIEEIIDGSFNHLIDTMIKFPENPYHINFEEIFFKGKADLIHKLEKIINQKDKIIEEINKDIEANIYLAESNYNVEELNDYARGVYDTYINMRKQYFERKAKDGRN